MFAQFGVAQLRDIGEQIGVDIDNDKPIASAASAASRSPRRSRSAARRLSSGWRCWCRRYETKTRTITTVDQKENLIGHDSMQATKAKIDFSRAIDDAFVEGETRVDDVVRLEITPAEASALRAWAKQHAKPRARRGHHATKKTSAQLDREIADALAKRGTRKARR